MRCRTALLRVARFYYDWLEGTRRRRMTLFHSGKICLLSRDCFLYLVTTGLSRLHRPTMRRDAMDEEFLKTPRKWSASFLAVYM